MPEVGVGVHVGADVIKEIIHFFRHPYLKAGEPNSYDVKVTIHTGYNTDHSIHEPEAFERIVWTMPVRNTKHSKRTIGAKDCIALIQFEVDSLAVGNEVALAWRYYAELPTSCDTEYALPGQIELRQKYIQHLGYHYQRALTRYARTRITIHKDNSAELLLLFTFESNFGYILVPREGPRPQHNGAVFYNFVDGLPLAFPFGQDIRFHLTFESGSYKEKNSRNYTLNIEAWDSISLRRV